MHTLWIRIEKGVENCATNLANKTKYMRTNEWKKLEKFCEDL
jgi:hypothetical protein